MHQLLLVLVGVVSGSTMFDIGRLRHAAELRVKSLNSQIANMQHQFEKKCRNLKYKNQRYQTLNCERWVKVSPASVWKKEGHLVYEALQPSFPVTWYATPIGSKAAYCSALLRSIENGQYDIQVGHTAQISHVNAIRMLYIGIMRKLDRGTNISDSQIVKMLETAGDFESRKQAESTIEILLEDYSRSTDVEDDPVPPVWPLEESGEYLTELMTDVVAEGFGEEKIIHFLNKVYLNMEISKTALAQIAKSTFVEIKEKTIQIGQDLYTLENEALDAKSH